MKNMFPIPLHVSYKHLHVSYKASKPLGLKKKK